MSRLAVTSRKAHAVLQIGEPRWCGNTILGSNRSTCISRRTAVHEKNTRPNVGQDSIDSSVNSNVYLLEELQALRRYLDQFLSGFNSMCERLHTRIVGKRDTNAEPDTDARPDTPRVPSIAITNDGRVLLSLHYVEGADISDREKWTGIVLIEEERFDVLASVADRADDAAAHVGGKLIAKAKKGEPKESGGDGR
jgi:hypothetical protein